MKIQGLRAALVNRLHREDVYRQPNYWDSKAHQLSGPAVSMWNNNHLNELYHRDQMRLLEEFLPNVEGRRLLDLGCGYGRVSRHFAALGAKVMGIDFSPATIDLAREQTEGDNPQFRIESVFDLAEVGVYDVVISLGTLVVACRDRGELKDMLRRLRVALAPGGRLLLLEPIHRGPLHRVLDMSQREFLAVMREVGLEPERVRHLHFWPMRLILAYGSVPRWLTRLGHRCGEALLAGLLRRRGGDYQAILTAPK